MTTTTVLARNYTLGRDYQVDGWMSYINNGEYTDDQQGALAEALMDAQEREFDNLLPDDCHWFPHLSEIHGPIDATLEGLELDELLEQASNAVTERFDEIEAETLSTVEETK
ncbi:hypothetical protein [Nonomuraea basaltis]|uniref:hypothetical protein n=1 Tax=Nonomuraea basaltis TaxID=2495887 RepID=UPI00110C504A|nr:hypothetical protein [Nonomuraea basaltis]TMS00204.1 hypothetical protein EJK15_03775 [Nonomuraea basaltis]